MKPESMSDKWGGKPWVAWAAAFLAFLNVTVGAYAAALWLPDLNVDALVLAGGFISAASAIYGISASRVKVKEMEYEEEV